MNILLITLEQTALHVPLICAAYIVYSLLKIPDLSLESAYLFGAVVASNYLATVTDLTPFSLISLLSAALVGGALVGSVSSLLSQRAGIPFLLASILTNGIFHGVTLYVLGNSSHFSLSALPNPLMLMPVFEQFPELFMLVAVALSVLLLCVFLSRTQAGYSMAIFGNNPHFFSHYGISTHAVVIGGTMIAAALAGLGGFLDGLTNGFVDLHMGVNKALLCLTSLILGKTLVGRTRPLTFAIPLLGIVSYFCLQQLLLAVGFNYTYFTAVQSIIVLGLLTVSYARHGKSLYHTDHLGV